MKKLFSIAAVLCLALLLFALGVKAPALLLFLAAALRLLRCKRVALFFLLSAALCLLRRERIALPLLRAAFLRFPSPCGTVWIAPTRFSAFVFHKPYSVSMICAPQSRRLCTRAA